MLNIDTAVETASVCLAENDTVLNVKENPSPKDSASWIHTAIKELLEEKNFTLHQLSAVAVTAGPGSYTGLRVGMATAKGLCYVLGVPLITVNTLQVMAVAALEETTDLLCPMIDARRTEVFTAVYNHNLKAVVPPQNLVLSENTLKEALQTQTVTFFGNGSFKFQRMIKHPNAVFKDIGANAKHLAVLAYKALTRREQADLAYSEPFYGKEFYSPAFPPATKKFVI